MLIHIEIQSQPETEFELRMFQYYYRIFDRYNQKVVSLAILGDDRAAWRPSSYTSSLWGCDVHFQFPVVKLLDYADSWQELETHENLFAVIVLAHLKSMETRQDAEQRRAWKFRLVRNLYERGMSADDVRQLFRFIDWMMDLPHELELVFEQELANFQQERNMPYITSIERSGIRRGLLKGIEVGLDLKFGDAGLKLLPEIRELHDHEKMEAILAAIKNANTPDELRQLWQQEKD